MFDRASVCIVPSHSRIVSPPQNCSKTVDFIKPSTGNPSDSANRAAVDPTAFKIGEFSILNTRYFSFNCESDLSANAVAVSWRSSRNSLIKWGFYHRGHREHRVNEVN